MVPSLNSGPAQSLLASLGLALALGAVLYIYIASMLMIIARKTATPGAWMAWVPIANVVLMCRIARTSLIWVLVAIIPFVNLVAIAVLGMGIARRCGKPVWIGLLLLIPVLGLLVPAYLAFGTPVAKSAQQPTMAAAAAAGQTSSPHGVTTPGVPSCGHPDCAGEMFCGYTGQRIASDDAAPGPATSASGQAIPACGHPDCAGETFCSYTGQRIAPAGDASATQAPAPQASAAASTSSNAAKAVVGGLLTVAVGVLITGAISISGRWFSGTPTQRQPQMTPHMAGTLSEFPVATGANPAHPKAIVSQNFSGDETPAQVRVPPKSLPPGLVPAKLPKIATSVTSAAYQARPQDPPVNVTVLSTREASQPAAEEVLKQIEVAVGPQATVTGIKVQNPSGSEYTGYRVRTQESDAYVLAKLGANILVTILSSHPSVRDVASQLAANLGNGAGLLEDPGMRGGMFSLPASPPPGFELEDMAVQDTAQLDQLRASLGVSGEGQQLAEKIQRFIPQRITSSTYKGPNSEKLQVMLGEYGGTASAWTTWTMLRMALRGLGKDANVNTNVNVRGGNAISIASQDKKALVFQRGAFLVVVHGAANAPQNHLVSLADSLQF